MLPALVLPELVLRALVLLALVFLAPVLLFQIQGQCITSTGARNTLLEVEFPMPVAHSGTVFRVLCKKISTGQEKLAPIDWHDWHVFATLLASPHYLLFLNKRYEIRPVCENFS